MEKIIPNGTEVLIFGLKYNSKLKEITYVKGTVIDSKEHEIVPMHGSSWNEQLYTVVTEDGYQYYLHEGYSSKNPYIETIPNAIYILNNHIDTNLKAIEALKIENHLLMDTIKELMEEENKKDNKLVKNITKNDNN